MPGLPVPEAIDTIASGSVAANKITTSAQRAVMSRIFNITVSIGTAITTVGTAGGAARVGEGVGWGRCEGRTTTHFRRASG